MRLVHVTNLLPCCRSASESSAITTPRPWPPATISPPWEGRPQSDPHRSQLYVAAADQSGGPARVNHEALRGSEAWKSDGCAVCLFIAAVDVDVLYCRISSAAVPQGLGRLLLPLYQAVEEVEEAGFTAATAGWSCGISAAVPSS